MKIVIILLVFVGIILAITGICYERKGYNNGECPHCNKKLRHFDNDSQGGRLYICDKCGYFTAVSYSCVDKRRINKKINHDGR